MRPKVSIVILNWNGLNDTVECLESLKKITYPNYNVIVVDNGSSGNDAEELQAVFGDYIDLIRNDTNSGFAGGVNIGIRYALTSLTPDYILSLNNDTVVDPRFLDRLVEGMENDSSIGIAGSKVYFYDFPNRLQTAGERINMMWGQGYSIGIGEEDCGQYDIQAAVGHGYSAYIYGVCFLIRTKIIQDVGLLDESFFCYWEEADYCFRAKEAGYKLLYVPESKIWHKKYMKKNPFDKPPIGRGESDSALYYHTRNSFKFMRRYATKRQYLSYILFFFGCYSVRVVAGSLLIHKNPKRFGSFCSGIKDGLLGKSGSRN